MRKIIDILSDPDCEVQSPSTTMMMMMMMMIMMMTLTIVTKFRRQYSFWIIPYCFCTSNISGFWARLSSYSCRFVLYEQLSRWLIIGLVVLSASSYQERNKIVIPGYYFGRTVSAKLHVSWLKTKLKTKHRNEKTVSSKAHKREYHEVQTTAVSLPINKETNGIMEKVEKQFTLSI